MFQATCIIRCMKGVLCSVLTIASSASLHAHKEPTHQYIIREAYALLKKHLGKSIPEFDLHIMGNDGLGKEGEFDNQHSDPWAYSTMCGGAWGEDYHDPVRHMHDIEVLFKRGMFSSINHFWDPDQSGNGFNSAFELHLPWNPWPTGILETNICSLARTYLSDYEHDLMAFKKAMIYLSSNEYRPKLHESFTFMHQGHEYPSPGTFNYSLFDWYHGVFEYADLELETRKKDIIYSILGRVAHLLGDMSIPAHVKCDEHGLWHDPYEDAMNYVEWEGNKESPCIDMNKNIPASPSMVEYWDHERVFSEKGSIVLPSCVMFTENPYWTLFYSTAQLSDHFASNRFDGDDNYLEIGELSSILKKSNNQDPTKTRFIDGNPKASGYMRSTNDLIAIRDMTFPYVIRATAGLLYMIAQEFALINHREDKCPTTLSLRNAMLNAPHYVFEASDSIIAGNPSMPLLIAEQSKSVNFSAGTSIRFMSTFHAQKGSRVHAKISPCRNCYDDPPEISREIYLPQESAIVQFQILSLTTNSKKTTEGCCKYDPIISVECKNDIGESLNDIPQKSEYSELDIHTWLETQARGIYHITLIFEEGKQERRIIARL